MNALNIAAAGVTVVAAAAESKRVPVPNAADGDRARYVRIIATGWVFVKPGGEGAVCTVNDLLLAPGEAVVLSVKWHSHIAYLDEAGGARINIVPVEAEDV